MVTCLRAFGRASCLLLRDRPFLHGLKREAAMRCYWIIVAVWACCCSNNAQAQHCVASLFPPLPAQPSYNGLSPSYDPNVALTGWYAVATYFIDALWPDIPYEAALSLVNTTRHIPPERLGEISQTASYLFLDWAKAVVALFILGLLLAIIVPIVGICVCCCRLFRLCGGNYRWDYARDLKYKPKRAWCACITLTIITSLLIVAVCAGLVIAYISNTNSRVAVSETPETVDRGLEDVQTYLATLQRDVEFVGLEQYAETADCVVESVDNSFTSVVDGVARDLNVDSALNLADQVVMDVDAVNMLLTNITSSVMQLGMDQNTLEDALMSISNNLTTIRNDPICDSACDASLSLDASAFGNAASMVPNITTALMSANATLHSYDVMNFISSARLELNNTLSDISMQVEGMKQEVSDLLKGTVQENVNSSIGQLTRSLEEAVAQIEVIRNDTRTLLSMMVDLPHGPATYLDIANETRFALGVCFCAILTLIMFLAIAGLLFGSGGVLKGGISPPSRNRAADCGGRCLLASSGCIFIWWFLLMLVVTFAFLFGAVFQIPCDEVKHPSYNGVVKTLDDPEALSPFVPGVFSMLLQIEEVSFRESLVACSQNQSLFNATGLDRILLAFGIDFNGLLTNATEMIEQLKTTTTSSISSISVGSVTILSSTVVMELENVQNFTLQSVNVTGVVEGYNSALATVDLDTLFDALEDLQDQCTPTCTVGSDIAAAITSVMMAQTARDSIVQTVDQLNNDFNSAQSLAVNVSNTVGMLISEAIAANASLSNGTAIEASAKAYVSELFGIGTQYIQYLNTTLMNSVAPCYAPWAAFVGTTSHVCQGIVGSWNAYWFALGWSLLWCLPLIVFMIWLSGYFVKHKENTPKSPEVFRMREIVTGPATMGTINERETAHSYRVYAYPAGPVEQGNGVANVSILEEAEVHHNETVGEIDAAQANTPEEPPAVTVTDEGEAEINQSLVTANSRKFYDRRAQSFVYTNKFTMADLEREKKRLTPPPDYFTMYPRETGLDGSGPRTVVHEQSEAIEYETTW